ncbi:MAG: 23S rRNA (uracil(1939)-C(5))-methyltransferase RlmD [Clostridium sp.]|nr:23S rRNA (uracil(1939)-C(5))-methyltransferase RlmD [Clostridium sp.]
MRKNDCFELTIEDLSEEGQGVGKRDCYVWFVKDAVPGDRVLAQAVKVGKSYGYARISRILEPSGDRTGPRCPAAGPCGGCDLQVMDYRAQLRFKEKKVKDHLERIGGVRDFMMEPILGMEEEGPWRYRGKAQVPVGLSPDGRVITGYYAARSHRIVECPDCLLGPEENETILAVIRRFLADYHILPYDEARHEGVVRHVLIRKGFKTGQILVCLIINAEKLPHTDELVRRLREIPGIACISLNINREKTNVILGKKTVTLFGTGTIDDYIGNVRFSISPQSFFQVNPIQVEKLYRTALEYAELTGGENVWDLYCGIGTISLFLAAKAGKVRGVEIVEQAVRDARKNAAANGIRNVEFYAGKAEEVFPAVYAATGERADVVVVDPPRKGCDETLLSTIADMAPDRIVYVSCNSATLARDVKLLSGRGYRLIKARCCDMFPMSTHVETVCLLSKLSEAKNHISVKGDIDDKD